MIWMLDTNVIIHLCNHAPGHDRIFRRMSGRSPGELRISSVTLCELEFGIENGQRREQNRAAVDDMLGLLRVDDLPAAAARHYAEIKAALRSKGRPTRPYDLLIGAHARAIGATLVTSDTSDFRSIPGLRLTNWLKP